VTDTQRLDLREINLGCLPAMLGVIALPFLAVGHGDDRWARVGRLALLR